jgi:phospholipid/cholesterol/gamma-HCH transport system substrate-binding protein
MKQTSGNNIKLGMIVSVSIALFIIAIYFIGQKQQLFSSTFNIHGIFKNINGLKIGNNVRFSGINVGVIENIEQVTDSTVRVDMIIDESSRKFIKKNATAIISADGFMGDKIMVILPGAAGQISIADNDAIHTSTSVSIDEILLKLKITADNAAEITTGLALITNNISSGNGTIGKLFMDTVFADNLDQTIVNIKQGTGGFKENMDAAGNSFLLRGLVNKKEKQKEKLKEEKEDAAEDKQKKLEKELRKEKN